MAVEISELNINEPGLYRHKETGKELVAEHDIHADAYSQVGFVRVGSVPTPAPEKAQEEVKTSQKEPKAKNTKKETK